MPDDKKEPLPDDDEMDEVSAKARLKELMADIDMHGVPRIQMDLHIAKKVIWITVMFTLLGVAVWQLYTVVEYFTSWPTSTTFEYVYAREKEFPAVTLCNLNPVRNSRTTRLPDGSAARTFFDAQKAQNTGNAGPQQSGTGTFSWDNINFSDQRTDYDAKVLFYQTYMALSDEEKQNVGYGLKEMMLDCAFNGKTCSPRNFTRTVHAQFGNCFTFNTPDDNGDVASVSASGPIHGLSLTMLIDQTDYFPTISEAAGLKVLVHNQKKFPFPEDAGMLVSPGTDTQIGVRQVVVLREVWPYGNCVNVTDEEAKKKDAYTELLTGVNYTAEGCENTCFQKKVVEECNCKHAFYVYTGSAFDGTDVPTADFCKLNERVTRICIGQLERKLHNGSLTCNKDCPPSCIDYSYPSTVASSTWPAHKKEKDVINMLSTTNPALQQLIEAQSTIEEKRLYMSEEILKVSVFYEDMKYQYVVTARAYTVAEMASDLGGTVELYLGLSIVTLVEMIEFFMDLCFICSQKRKIKKTMKNKTAPAKA
ncbi:amiloride-sensitive sodium channel subunit gamma-like [Lineus longissimus]|uniref:amiloride-sensitive sodium channel subunit gamma-like n=1 Tax=Lineus longissimus TaxID=88925 RepID=UPI002B4DA030